MSDQQLAVEMRGITKQFPGVLANNHVDLSVRTGEIHALVGENGAGKSTLMNILYGLIRPDSGEILINGKPVHMAGPRDAISLGIGMVHQHFMLIPVFSVGENIMLGREPVTGTDLYDHARARNAINDLTKRYGLALDPDARMGDLPVGLQQRAEIVKVLYRGAGILILDEPTGVLTPQETKELFVVLRDLVKSGKTIIFISHKLKEVLDISDRITVMRRGQVVGHLTTRETNEEEIATLMVGRAVLLRVDKKPAKPGAVVLRVEDVSANSEHRRGRTQPIRRQSAEGHRRPGDGEQTKGSSGGSADARRGHRRDRVHPPPDRAGARRRHGGAPRVRRTRRGALPVRPHRGHVRRQDREHREPGHARGTPWLAHDRRRQSARRRRLRVGPSL